MPPTNVERLDDAGSALLLLAGRPAEHERSVKAVGWMEQKRQRTGPRQARYARASSCRKVHSIALPVAERSEAARQAQSGVAPGYGQFQDIQFRMVLYGSSTR